MSTADGDDVSESLCDIDDAEIAGYLNSKKAALFKRLIWEAMNKDYDEGKRRKRAKKADKAVPAKKAIKVSATLNDKKCYSPGREQEREPNNGGGTHQPNEKKSFGGSPDDEFEHEDPYSGYEEYDGCDGYNYDEEYEFDEI